jgi:hypothetical protein
MDKVVSNNERSIRERVESITRNSEVIRGGFAEIKTVVATTHIYTRVGETILYLNGDMINHFSNAPVTSLRTGEFDSDKKRERSNELSHLSHRIPSDDLSLVNASEAMVIEAIHITKEMNDLNGNISATTRKELDKIIASLEITEDAIWAILQVEKDRKSTKQPELLRQTQS